MSAKLRFLLAAIFAVAMLQGCLNKKADTTTADTSAVRLINATTDYATLDLYSSDTAVASGIATFAASDYISQGTGSITFKLKRGGSSTTSLATTRALTKDVKYTMVAFTSAAQLQVLFLADDETTPTSGYGKVRVVNTSSEAGSVDVYVTAADASLSDVSPIASSVYGTGSYVDIGKGSYRIRVTGAGDKNDLRLDIPSIAISDQQILSLVLTTTSGGVLVDGFLITQGGAVSAQKNTQARLRLAAGIASNGTVSATANDIVLSSGVKSPTVGAYALVPAGSLSMNVTVNGANVSASGLTAVAGADLTLLVMGDAASPQFHLLNDDNRPATSGSSKLRLVNGINGGSNISLLADYGVVASDVAAGTASSAATISNGSAYRLEVTSSTSTSLYLATDVSLLSTNVYSIFMLNDTAGPVGILRRDR